MSLIVACSFENRKETQIFLRSRYFSVDKMYLQADICWVVFAAITGNKKLLLRRRRGLILELIRAEEQSSLSSESLSFGYSNCLVSRPTRINEVLLWHMNVSKIYKKSIRPARCKSYSINSAPFLFTRAVRELFNRSPGKQ